MATFPVIDRNEIGEIVKTPYGYAYLVKWPRGVASVAQFATLCEARKFIGKDQAGKIISAGFTNDDFGVWLYENQISGWSTVIS